MNERDTITTEQEIQEMYQAAAVIKRLCNRRKADDACRYCPFRDMCGAEPYAWEV